MTHLHNQKNIMRRFLGKKKKHFKILLHLSNNCLLTMI